MSTTSASPAESSGDMPERARAVRKVLVWDAPVRLFHWLMVLSFAGAYLTAESERWRLIHVTLSGTPWPALWRSGSCGDWWARGTRASRASCVARRRSRATCAA